jgi:hypothetical protein
LVLGRAGAAAVVCLLGTVLPAGAAPAPAAGVLQGRVEVRRETRGTPSRPDVAALGMPEPRGIPDRTTSVVYLESAPRGAFEIPPPGHAVLDQRNETFVPHVLAVTVGSVVDFANDDRTYHNVFSLSKTKRFDLGRYPRGESRSVRFDRPGVVRVFCEIHSHMNAFILVFAHRYFDTTDREGRYRIGGIPPGTYTVAVWNEGEVRARREVSVGEGNVVEQDFEVE